MKKLGEDACEIVEHVPASSGMRGAEPRFERGMAGPRLLAHVLTATRPSRLGCLQMKKGIAFYEIGGYGGSQNKQQFLSYTVKDRVGLSSKP